MNNPLDAVDRSPTPREAAAQKLLYELVGLCIRQNASDLHLVPGLPPYLRIDGVLEPQPQRGPISREEMTALAEELVWPYDRAPLEKTGALDGAFSSPDGARFRFNLFRKQGELAIAFRRLE